MHFNLTFYEELQIYFLFPRRKSSNQSSRNKKSTTFAQMTHHMFYVLAKHGYLQRSILLSWTLPITAFFAVIGKVDAVVVSRCTLTRNWIIRFVTLTMFALVTSKFVLSKFSLLALEPWSYAAYNNTICQHYVARYSP